MEDKTQIEKLINGKKRVKIVLRNNDIFVGVIEGCSNNSIQMKDKFNDDVLIFIRAIQTIKVLNGGRG